MCFTWIHAYLSRADQNGDDKMSYDEVRTLLQMINIDLSDQYARSLFQVMKKKTTNTMHFVHKSRILVSGPDLFSHDFMQQCCNSFMFL